MLNSTQKGILEKLINGSTTPQALIKRAKIILHAAKNDSTYFIVRHLKVTWKTVQKWVKRWMEYLPEFAKIKAGDENVLRKVIIECLSDSQRSGKPPILTPEQIVKITSLACTTPKSHGIPLSHWNTRSLALQAVKMGIVQKISHAKIATILKQGHLKPHRSQYWLNSRARNSDIDFDARVNEICTVYKTAIKLSQEGVHVISVDEKSGMQAIERADPNLPMIPGSPEKIEHEYERHGTLCLIGNLEIATGKIIEPMLSPTRKEKDFLKNIKNVVGTDPEGQWIFILDQLNTHKSESLVKWVAKQIGFEGHLGKSGDKGYGILKSMVSRQKFLEDKSHRVCFLFTPKHCSWMNQIEIWFSGLSRRYLKRTSFPSVRRLKQGVLGYINHYNEFAKAFRWTYEGKVLQI